jgi:hypothetical protein
MNGVIFQCASCRALGAIHDVQVHDDRAGLACGVCGSVTWLPINAKPGASAGANVVVEQPKSLPPVTALVPQPGASPGAGVEQRDKIVEKLQALPAVTELQQKLAQDFEALLGSKWGDHSAHKELCQRASTAGELAFMGQRYRAVLDVVPNEPNAKRAQGDILTLATIALNATKDLGAIPNEDQRNRRRAAAMLAGAAILVVILVIMQMLGLLRRDEQQEMIDPVEMPPFQNR